MSGAFLETYGNKLGWLDTDDIILAGRIPDVGCAPRVLWPLGRADIEPRSSERFGEVILGIGNVMHFSIPLVGPPDTPTVVGRFAWLPHQEGPVERQELTAWPQDAVGFADDIIGPVDGNFVEQNLGGDDIEVIVRELGILGQALGEVDVDAEIRSPHMGIAHHRSTDVDAPYFGVGEPFLERHGVLADAATKVEAALHPAVVGNRGDCSIVAMPCILIVAVNVKVVGAVVVHVAGETDLRHSHPADCEFPKPCMAGCTYRGSVQASQARSCRPLPSLSGNGRLRCGSIPADRATWPTGW